ncbi:MAG: glutamine--tRNA ligase/YqeY domain fusion protein [Candidatus Cloacimonetes bacterium]|nr:glutamine--tRNA ligase/YqeY domain fusion protein [Candidatus Cloacimonadota bacterium]
MSDKDTRPEGGEAEAPRKGLDFIREIIAEDLKSGKHTTVHTRFPPEPNGHLHIGHAKSICLNFSVAAENGGLTNLRFDDTNPETEEQSYVDAIKRDVHWLGFDWDEREYHASDYFGQLYIWAQDLIRSGKAYVCSLSDAQIREYRGTVTEPGRNSPDRERPAEESLRLLEEMRQGLHPDGTYTLRAKIAMDHVNMKMRDPLVYRIRRVAHHRAGDSWNIYPMYDFAHGLSDSIEGITHSLCTLEFENNRELYDWFLDNLEVPSRPRQIEFARLNLGWTVMSKRRLLELVRDGHVKGWDDPRLPTIAGMRRRGYSPRAIREFCDRVGVARRESTVDIALLESVLREDLNHHAPRTMAVLRPLKVVIENWPEGQVDWLEAQINPEQPELGNRRVPFSRELWIEREDFMENPPKDFFRLAPGREVRLRSGYFITCTSVIRNEQGEITELRCSHDPETRGGNAPDGRKVKATLHWVSAAHAIPAEVRLYDRLFTVENPNKVPEGGSFLDWLNPAALETVQPAWVEADLDGKEAGWACQFERLGYFCVDPDSRPGALVFNRTVTLRDTWARIQSRGPRS